MIKYVYIISDVQIIGGLKLNSLFKHLLIVEVLDVQTNIGDWAIFGSLFGDAVLVDSIHTRNKYQE